MRTFPELIKDLSRFDAKLEPKVENGKWRIVLTTATHTYSISAASSYLGCICSLRLPYPGEDYTRGNDCADGNYSEETWHRILCDIVSIELNAAVRCSPVVVNPNPTPKEKTMSRYVANPVEVDAFVIMEVKPMPESQNCFKLLLDDGRVVEPDGGMVARMTPRAGDYWVVQSDGYIYLNPKDVFERKYRRL